MASLWKIFGLRRLDGKFEPWCRYTAKKYVGEKNTGILHLSFLKYDKLLRLAQMISILSCQA